MEEIISHGLTPEAFTGQNGGKNPSSTMGMKKGEQLPRSKFPKSVISGDGSVTVPTGNGQVRPVSSHGAVPINPGTKGASAGGTVPLSNVRKANDNLFRAVGQGNMRK